MNTGLVILIAVISVTFYIGRWAIREGQRIEENKEFMKNLNKFDKKKK